MSKKTPNPQIQAAFSFANLDGKAIEEQLRSYGYAHVSQVVKPEACHDLLRVYDDPKSFRKQVVMEQHHFGIGEYAYFSEPLPPLVDALRTQLYEQLVPIANRMMRAMRRNLAYPPTLNQFRNRCRGAGQTKPTPLMLRYERGGYNCLHRDLYGPTVFPLQAMVMLSQKHEEFEGGEFVLVENRPRQQSRATVLTPSLGDLIIFPVSDRPIQGKRGILRANTRHGVSRIHKGHRWALGIIFHDAK